MRRKLRVIGRLTLPLLITAQTPPTVPPPTTDDVVVTAKTQQAVDRLVASLTQAQRGKQIARWQDAVCPRTLGIDPGQAAFVIKRLGEIARRLNVPVGGAKCSGNVVAVFTDDADGFARALVRDHPKLFRDPREGLAPRKDRDDLLRPLPVRWVASSRTTGPGGVPIAFGINPIFAASRLKEPTREASALSLIIVDTRRLGGLTWGQVADYLAMVAFARPDLTASYADEETIMSLFDRRDRGVAAPAGLTPDDLALLTALYATDPEVNARAQRAAIGVTLRHRPSAAPAK